MDSVDSINSFLLCDSDKASESTMSDDEISIVFESVPVRDNAPQSAEKNSKEIKRDPEDFSRCCFCNKTMSCVVEYITHTAGCPENKNGIVGKATENQAESSATDSPGRSISDGVSDRVLSPAFSPVEDSGVSLSPGEASGRSVSPDEVSGPALSPGKVSGPSLSPCEVSEPIWFSDAQLPATSAGYTSGDGCLGERDQDLSRAGYFTQSNAAVESLPSPPPEDVSPQVSRLTFHSGGVTDACYRKPSTAILIIGDCVAVKPAKGLATDLIHKYPYGDVYSSRRPISNLNRACVQDRPNPGTYTISRSSSNDNDPAIVTVFGQFYMGPGFESNRFSQKLVQDMKARAGYWLDPYTPTVDPRYCDLNLLTGLQWDMQENRVYWFRQALEELAGVVREEGIDRVVIPYGIGCGPAGGNWLQEYLLAVEAFEAQVRRHGVQVVIVTKLEDKKPVASSRKNVFYQNKCRTHRSANKPYLRHGT
ncbi:uncharacterized protein [Macrobrachium rosenbergii]|uniref:uncharacterized protein n=1 Tax=Macrobrachium rosenbergii TaxID=79674 RepID=UPI0034D3E877